MLMSEGWVPGSVLWSDVWREFREPREMDRLKHLRLKCIISLNYNLR